MKKKGLFSHYSSFEKRDFPFIYILIAFPLVQFAVFWFYANISSLGLAFTGINGAFTFNNFKTVFDAFTAADMYGINLGKSLLRSLILWLVGECLCFPISIITTYVLAKKVRGHYILRVCYIIPGLVGSIIWTALVKFLVSYDGGVTQLLIKMGINLPPGALRFGLLGDGITAFPTLVTVRFIMGIVGNNTVMTGAFSRVPNELFESARLDGAGFWTECFRIAIPCIWSTLSTLITFALCSIFTCDYNVYLYTNGTGQPDVSTIGFQIFNLTYRLSQGTSDNYGYPAALGLTLTMLTLPVVLIGRRVLEKIQDTVEV